jgi:hypothetical protein
VQALVEALNGLFAKRGNKQIACRGRAVPTKPDAAGKRDLAARGYRCRCCAGAATARLTHRLLKPPSTGKLMPVT